MLALQAVALHEAEAAKRNYYEVLGLQKDANENEIRRVASPSRPTRASWCRGAGSETRVQVERASLLFH